MPTENAWFKNATAYHLLIDRFAGVPAENYAFSDQPVFCGGKLSAIIDRLDYLQDLGIDTLWLSPFMQSTPNEDAYHGYHVTDYQSVDSRFGTLDDLDALVQAAYQRGMRVVADFVPNHVHEHCPFFFDWDEKGRHLKPGFEDWFQYKENGELSAYFGYGMIPQLNLDHPPARQYMIESALFWLSRGIDGLRLDYAAGPSHDFWQEFSSTIKSHFPASVLIGEVWHEFLFYEHFDQVGLRNRASKVFRERIDRDELQAEYVGSLDGVLDFSFQSIMVHYFQTVKKFGESPKLKKALLEALEEHYAQYPDDFFLVSFLDNHDIDRFLFSVGGQPEFLKQAFEIQMAQQQPALIYYGSELGLTNRA
ncbi:MAG: alpha-amylase family glycosyl hydrolase, partial [Bacteroidota bacterium]